MSDATGVLLLDKPVGPSSRDVLDALEPRLGAGPLGHAGTLDPRASGLLVALIGRARKLQDFFTGRVKRYRAVVRFGATTETLDGEAPEVPTGVAPPASDPGAARALLGRFLGASLQTPPAYSAVRIGGRRAYDLARAGASKELPARPVRFDALDLVGVAGPDWTVDVTCSAGAYVRSLARDLGLASGAGAYLLALRRVGSGTFDVAAARPPSEARLADALTLEDALRGEPRIDVDAADAVRLRDGLPIAAPGVVDDGKVRFAWVDGTARFRLKTLRDGFVRSDLLFGAP